MSCYDFELSRRDEIGCSTPPLSPTKSVSTDGWLSPRTPCSPRKVQSCIFARDINNEADIHLTPPASPIKPYAALKFANLDALRYHPPAGQVSARTQDLASDCAVASHDEHAEETQVSHPCAWHHLRASLDKEATPDGSEASSVQRSASTLRQTSTHQYIGAWPPSSDVAQASSSSPVIRKTETMDPISPTPSTIHSLVDELTLATRAHSLHRRPGTSPLRSSQWVARGGMLPSSRRGLNLIPDRFISFRCPPTSTRDSFELNRPEERRDMDTLMAHGRLRSRDPFSRRLRRSARLNEELRGLREAHAVIVARSNAHRRNMNLNDRHDSYTLSTRQISVGAVWNVGGPSAVSDTVVGVSTGRGGMLASGTTAPLYRSAFLDRTDPEAERETYERRLALALNIDQMERILRHGSIPFNLHAAAHGRNVWRDGTWTREGDSSLLDAPQLRDDYYCTLLAYSYTANSLAVGLGSYVHLWSERSGVNTPEALNAAPNNPGTELRHITSLDFSSVQGGQAILAVGRADGRILLWSTFDEEPRFDAIQPKPISCVSWRPTTVQRPSLRDRDLTVPTEELLVGDEAGHIYFYSVEWPSDMESSLFGWHGAMTLLVRMKIHTQQICGLAWAPLGDLFASGGNDNNCFLFESRKVLQSNSASGNHSATVDVREGPSGESIYTLTNRSSPVLQLPHTAARHKWTLNAAVKAIAFCPWQRGLVAVGGGSNDRCIHFYHTRSGTCLATIDCAAQVTSLLWSQGKREIAATFGFAQPEHPYRVAVFAWPSCEQVVAVPWWDENRALLAIAYPGTSNRSVSTTDRDGESAARERNQGVEDGCIVVATSDMAIRFHEIWGDQRDNASTLGRSGVAGLLGGSEILEGLQSIERTGAVIR